MSRHCYLPSHEKLLQPYTPILKQTHQMTHTCPSAPVATGAVSKEEIAAAEALLDPQQLEADQAECRDIRQHILGRTTRDAKLAKVKFGKSELWCDVSGEKARPLVPLEWRKMLAKTFHELKYINPNKIVF